MDVHVFGVPTFFGAHLREPRLKLGVALALKRIELGFSQLGLHGQPLAK